MRKFIEGPITRYAGDLNCANLIIDAYDGIWIIDPAQLTLDDAAPFRDYAKSRKDLERSEGAGVLLFS